jgi:hypothetical protein
MTEFRLCKDFLEGLLIKVIVLHEEFDGKQAVGRYYGKNVEEWPMAYEPTHRCPRLVQVWMACRLEEFEIFIVRYQIKIDSE